MPGKYRRDFEEIQNKFAQLFLEITEILEKEESVRIGRLKGYVSKFPEMKNLLDDAHTISDIINKFIILFDFLNGSRDIE